MSNLASTIRLNSAFNGIEEDLVDLESLWLSGSGRLLSVEILQPVWNTKVANIIAAPDGCPVNWFRDERLPMGFPGWSARLFVGYEGEVEIAPDVLASLGIHAMAGYEHGSESENGFWLATIVLFAEDWPDLFSMERLRGTVTAFDQSPV